MTISQVNKLAWVLSEIDGRKYSFSRFLHLSDTRSILLVSKSEQVVLTINNALDMIGD